MNVNKVKVIALVQPFIASPLVRVKKYIWFELPELLRHL